MAPSVMTRLTVVGGEVRDRALKEGRDGGRLLIAEQLAVGQPAVVVDHGVEGSWPSGLTRVSFCARRSPVTA
jgi:hypothetical protein